MIREFLRSDFRDQSAVKAYCKEHGMSKADIKKMKKQEGIKTIQIMNAAGERMWLWYDPEQVFAKEQNGEWEFEGA